MSEDSYAGERFWLQRGARLVSGSLPQLDSQAERLGTAVAWFWSLYVVLVGTWSTVGGSLPVVSTIPVVTLMMAYLGALWAQFPVTFRFDPRAPELVRLAHERMVAAKKLRLLVAFALLLASAGSIAIALLVSIGG